MKSEYLLVFFVLCVSHIKAQDVKTDSLYIVTYTTGSAWNTSLRPDQQPHFKEHGARLGELRKSGVIKFGARYAEKGIIVISSATLQSAKALISEDPAVSNKLFNADVQKLRVFYDWMK
jgi:hypothetical protein